MVGKPNSDEIKLFKNGTTPVLTFFYNQPWNNATTSRAPFLSEPEVHLSCLRTVPSAKQESGAGRLQSRLAGLSMGMLFTCMLVWVSMAF